MNLQKKVSVRQFKEIIYWVLSHFDCVYFILVFTLYFTDCVIGVFPTTTESHLRNQMAKYLKFAPDRLGGGGRQKTIKFLKRL